MVVPTSTFADVVVVGSGPAGWALADHCVRNGLLTALVAPAPTEPWTATYGLWTTQTGGLPPGSAVVRARRVLAGDHVLNREYAVLDNEAVRRGYARQPVHTVAAVVTGVEHRSDRAVVALESGGRLACRLVVDASGRRRALSGGQRRGSRPEQTAYGMIFPTSVAEPLVGRHEAVFMRWAGDTAGPPTFLYAVPLPDDRVLLEETSLVRRPGLALVELKRRLLRRLEHAGIPSDAATSTEHVRFAMDAPRPGPRGADLSFGVAAGMMHPATGYSVGEALTSAPPLARAIAEALPRGRDEARRAARAQLWSYRARAVRRLRVWGQRTLLTLAPEQVPEFFDAFFSIPEHLQDAYLCGRDDLAGTVAAMAAVHRAASARLRAAMVTGALPQLTG
ncbi:lycopene cyclase family protein [Actinophytocola oryzae]|uniref:lycopene cyclase family protein n=1 Tax=Actinophytocola oryzae TaxID=502181 RepID=UPI001AAEDE9E|nr:lycopene cyclase family protein [Actinophytocola oryzae]